MDQQVIVYLDGEWMDEGAASISVTDRGFLMSEGVFETALLFDGAYLRLDEHLHRLAASAAVLGITPPPHATLAQLAYEAAERNRLREGSLRITVTSGPSAARTPTVLITLSPRDPAWIERARRGWRIITARTRRPSTAAIPAQLKALGRTYSLLARREAKDAGVDDALLLTDANVVCEGPSWNVFWRTGGTLFTPALDVGVLGGVTRSMLIGIAAEAGYNVEEGSFDRRMLDDADEIFATMTSVGIAPIRALDSRVLPESTPAGDVLYERYWSAVAALCAPGRHGSESV